MEKWLYFLAIEDWLLKDKVNENVTRISATIFILL